MNDTPRTNAMLTAILETHGHVGFLNCPPTWVALARELERELNTANIEIEEKRKDVVWLATEKAKLENYVMLLEKAGDEIVDHNIGCGCGQDGPCRACRMACEAWYKAKENKP